MEQASHFLLNLTFLHVLHTIVVTIRAIVGIRVLNKTSEEYWFLLKSNLSQVGQNASMKDLTDYFLVHLHIASRYN